MPRSKPKLTPPSAPAPATVPMANGATGEVLTLSEAADYLRLPEPDVLRLVEEQDLPARQLGKEWRFLKAAIQAWLSTPRWQRSKPCCPSTFRPPLSSIACGSTRSSRRSAGATC